jgi:uncharacterized protein
MEIYVGFVFLLAGLVKGVIGMGLPTVSVGLLCLVMPPAQAAALLVAPSLATNAWQMIVGGHLPAMLRRFWPMMLGVAVGTGTVAAFFSVGAGGYAANALGLVLALYGALGLANVPLGIPARVEPILSPVVGLATGVVTATTGSFVMPSVPYLQSLGLGRDQLVQALGLSFTVSTSVLAIGLARDGVLQSLAGPSILALIPAALGMMLGQALRRRVRESTFRRCFFLGMLALGLQLALKGMV